MLKPLSITLLVLVTQLSLAGLAQSKHKGCGTLLPNIQIMGLQAITVPEDPECTFINKVNRTLQISLHICLDSDGNPNIDMTIVDAALQRLNQDFAPSGLQFQYCTITYMENHELDDLTVSQGVNEETHMTILHYEPNTINLYLVNSIANTFSEDLLGYTYYPNEGKDLIVMRKISFNDYEPHFSHQMGHYFGLYHTDETQFGAEHPNGSNCQTTGDLVCDTRADPSGDADPEDQCNYAGPTYQYAAGIWYVPSTDNYMSGYYETFSSPQYDCRCRFTPQQYNRMISQCLSFRNYLW